MKAMILAAGLGTRLRPLTDDRPKALVEIGGRTLLEICLEYLRGFGVNEVIVNTHHYAEMVEAYLTANGNFGMRIEISREETLLDTGGGLKQAAWFFEERGGDESFLVHNVDVMSSIDLGAMVRFHGERGALATLAVQERKSSRYLVFDEDGAFCGRETDLVRDCGKTTALAFAGIHVVSPRIFSKMKETGAFSIIDAYLRLAGAGENVMAFRADGSAWRDLGRPESVAAAEREMRK
ncbi:MAG: nucleotidyltransferase family protein [Terracidiphilus sp.]|jgi:NDP-sugar pyrophosphorylase family protein